MLRLTILSGPAWPLPGAARRWIASEPAYVRLEIVDPASLGLPADDIEFSDREVSMARQLVETLSADFDASTYRDEYREQLLALIDKKAAGEEIVAQPQPDAPAKVLDLMAALEASLARAGTADASPDASVGNVDVAAAP